jgi:hypothetical protein
LSLIDENSVNGVVGSCCCWQLLFIMSNYNLLLLSHYSIKASQMHSVLNQ